MIRIPSPLPNPLPCPLPSWAATGYGLGGITSGSLLTLNIGGVEYALTLTIDGVEHALTLTI